MLFESVMIPYFLGFNVIIPEEQRANYDPEYSYELNKTTVVLREPLQITQLTSTVTCHIFEMDLRCLLHNIVYLSALKYPNLNVTYVISKEHIESEHWFQIKFDSCGILKVLVNQTNDKHIHSIIKEIVNQFKIGEFRVSDTLSRHSFVTKENVPIGSCATTYTLDSMQSMTSKAHDKTGYQEVKDNGIIIYKQTPYRKHTYVLIEKSRRDCDYSLEYDTFLNGMEVAKYEHVIEAFNDLVRTNLSIVTTLHGQLPSNPWNPLGVPVFKEITQLNLTSIKSPKTKIFDTSYSWIVLI